jgi:hypothetical protein
LNSLKQRSFVERFRPINEREKAEGENSKIDARLEFPDDRTVNVYYGGAKDPQIFTFDRVFANPATTQVTRLF